METIEDKAEKLYTNLPYHNFDHVMETLETAMEIVWECFSLGIRVDAQIVYCAMLFHDAGFHENEEDKGFDKKESYSAHLAAKSLKEYGFNKKFIDKIRKCILGTHMDTELKTKEEKIVRSADIFNISDEYNVFLDNNIILKKEVEEMSGEEMSWEDWKNQTKRILNKYISQELIVGDDIEIISLEDAKENLDKFLKENEDKLEARKKVLFPDK